MERSAYAAQTHTYCIYYMAVVLCTVCISRAERIRTIEPEHNTHAHTTVAKHETYAINDDSYAFETHDIHTNSSVRL